MSEATVPAPVGGHRRQSKSIGSFHAHNPSVGEPLDEAYPISSLEEALEAIEAADQAAHSLRSASLESVAGFLEMFAAGIGVQASRTGNKSGIGNTSTKNSCEIGRSKCTTTE